MSGKAFYNEIDPHAAAWLRELIAAGLITNGVVDERSITDINPSDVMGFERAHFFAGIGGWDYALAIAGWSGPVWTGSCPCQPFSVAGGKRGTDDERHLWPAFFRLIRECKPAIVFGEQVPNADWMRDVSADLIGIGRQVESDTSKASDFGASHERRRTYWCSVADTNGIGQPQSGQHWENAVGCAADAYREADRLVDAFRRQALPFVCRGHDGLPAKLGHVALKGLGNAIVIPHAVAFIQASIEALTN